MRRKWYLVERRALFCLATAGKLTAHPTAHYCLPHHRIYSYPSTTVVGFAGVTAFHRIQDAPRFARCRGPRTPFAATLQRACDFCHLPPPPPPDALAWRRLETGWRVTWMDLSVSYYCLSLLILLDVLSRLLLPAPATIRWSVQTIHTLHACLSFWAPDSFPTLLFYVYICTASSSLHSPFTISHFCTPPTVIGTDLLPTPAHLHHIFPLPRAFPALPSTTTTTLPFLRW